MGTVAISGSAAGIGAATGSLLRAAGHDVIGIDRADAELVADLGTEAGRQAAVDGVLAACNGRLDGLVTAAGVPPRAPAADIVSINYFGTVALLTGLHGALAAAGRSRVVAVSSVMASTLAGVPLDLVEVLLAGDEPAARALGSSVPPNQHGRIYAATKVAIARWVRRHAPTAEWARAGIRMNAIAPGATKTAFFGEVADDDARQDAIPTGTIAMPEQVAVWITTMLGDAAEAMCGSVVYVDGGVDAHRRPDAWPTPPEPGGSRRFLRRR